MSWLVVILGYLIGSIPTAYIGGRILKRIDIRRIGDGNMGAANAFHHVGPLVGVAVGLIDASKGVLAILIAQAANVHQLTVLLTGVAAVIGHNWPVLLGFRGGRGESTTIGILLTLIPQPMLIMAGLALLVLLIKRNVILASVFLFVPLPLAGWLTGTPALLIAYGIVLPSMVGLTHLLRTRQRLTRHA